MERRLAFAFSVAGAVAAAVMAIDLGACSSDSGQPALSCKLGGGCSATQACTGGIAGCESDCQCLGGTWQSPCPTELPQSGSSCTGEGATCGYLAQTPDACGDSIDCSCRGGAWTCSPNCFTPPDAGPDAAGCIASGGECLFSNVICAVPGPQSCGGNQSGSYCCVSNVADCGQPSAITYACPAAQPDAGPGCTNVPVPLGAPNYVSLDQQTTDDDASYSLGCRATFPACNNGHVPYCTCEIQGQSGFSAWSCFN
jgi:hypothetical protein